MDPYIASNYKPTKLSEKMRGRRKLMLYHTFLTLVLYWRYSVSKPQRSLFFQPTIVLYLLKTKISSVRSLRKIGGLGT